MVAEPPKAALLHRSASGHVVASITRSDCFRLERQLPGGVRTRWEIAPFHGAPQSRICPFVIGAVAANVMPYPDPFPMPIIGREFLSHFHTVPRAFYFLL